MEALSGSWWVCWRRDDRAHAMEIEILEQAAAYFAQGWSHTTVTPPTHA